MLNYKKYIFSILTKYSNAVCPLQKDTSILLIFSTVNYGT